MKGWCVFSRFVLSWKILSSKIQFMNENKWIHQIWRVCMELEPKGGKLWRKYSLCSEMSAGFFLRTMETWWSLQQTILWVKPTILKSLYASWIPHLFVDRGSFPLLTSQIFGQFFSVREEIYKNLPLTITIIEYQKIFLSRRINSFRIVKNSSPEK